MRVVIMAFFGSDGLEHQLKQIKAQLASKGWCSNVDLMNRADTDRLRDLIGTKRAEEEG